MVQKDNSMNMNSFAACALALGLLNSLSGCGTAAGAAGTAIASSAASGAMASGTNRARFMRQDCDQLAQEIASARMAMINPVAIPSTRAYIRDARAVADEKGCPPDA